MNLNNLTPSPSPKERGVRKNTSLSPSTLVRMGVKFSGLREILFVTLINLIIITYAGYSQEKGFFPIQTFSIFGGISSINNNAELQTIPAFGPGFENLAQPIQIGYFGGLSYQLSLPFDLSIGLKGLILNQDGRFSRTGVDSLILNSQKITGTYDRKVNVDFLDFGIGPYIAWNFLPDYKLIFGGEARLHFTKNFRKYDQVTTPSSAVFIQSGLPMRYDTSGTLPDAESVTGSLFFGINYTVNLVADGSFSITPELTYHLGISNITSTGNWKINNLRGGLAFNYTEPYETVKEKPKVPELRKEQIIKVDTVPMLMKSPGKPFIKIGIPVIDTSARNSKRQNVIIETIRRIDTLFTSPKPIAVIKSNVKDIHVYCSYVTSSIPLVPFIFFKQGSDKLQSDYEIQDINYAGVELYVRQNFHILAIISERLKKDKKAKIMLTGCSDPTTENSDCLLAYSRSESVKKYIVENLSVNPEQIVINNKKTCAPAEPTLTSTKDGYAENSRVEISTNTPEIILTTPLGKRIEIDSIIPRWGVINTEGSTKNYLEDQGFDLNQDDYLIYSSAFILPTEDGYDESGRAIMWKSFEISDEGAKELVTDKPITLKYFINDSNGVEAEDSIYIRVFKDTSTIEKQRLSVLLFSFGSDRLPEASESEIKRFLKNAKKDSKLNITGYTDYLGDFTYNVELSKKRAENAAAFIKSNYPKININKVEGVGSGKYPPGIKSYKTPIERFLSRAVLLELFD